MRQGKTLPLGDLDNRRDLIGVRNLADLLVTLLREETAGTYLVCDREPVSSTRLVELIAEAYGGLPVRGLAFRLPVGGTFAERLFGDVRVDDTALRQASSWHPRYTVSNEITAMLDVDAR